MALARELYCNAVEAPQFRDANERANSYLDIHPNLLTRHNPGTKDKTILQALLRTQLGVDVDKLDDATLYHKFLTVFVGLDSSAIDEVDSTTFKLLDAHYLEGCNLLHEIVRSMPLQGLTPVEQAAFCFSWVTRQVVLEEGRDELLPPQYALQRGQGSAAERTFLFISLLQQLNPSQETSGPHFDGCLIALPGKDGHFRPWLSGVLITTKDRSELYLFEPRLGIPVPDPEDPTGKKIATLAQLRANPGLLDGLGGKSEANKYNIDAVQAAQAEILLACPLSGLSPRMRYLEDELLYGFERNNVAIRVANLWDKFAKLGLGPVGVWNQPALKADRPAQSPTEALRFLLPPEEGGVDKSKRLEQFTSQLLPGWAILQGFANEKLAHADLPIAEAQQRLAYLASQIWINFIQAPSQDLVRGRLDDCIKRLVRIQRNVEEVKSKTIDGPAIGDWRKKVRAAYVEKDRDPAKVDEIWTEDQWLLQLVNNPDEDFGNPRQMPKKILSDIVLSALSEPLQPKCAYLLALRWQEKAERLELRAAGLAAGTGSVVAKARQDARDAWNNAGLWWSAYEREDVLSPARFQVRLAVAKAQINGNRFPLALGLLDYQGQIVREAAAAKLLHIRMLRQTARPEIAEAMLKEFVAELTDLETYLAQNRVHWDPYLKVIPAPLRGSLQAALNKFAQDFTPAGSLFWMRQAANLEMARLRRTQF